MLNKMLMRFHFIKHMHGNQRGITVHILSAFCTVWRSNSAICVASNSGLRAGFSLLQLSVSGNAITGTQCRLTASVDYSHANCCLSRYRNHRFSFGLPYVYTFTATRV